MSPFSSESKRSLQNHVFYIVVFSVQIMRRLNLTHRSAFTTNEQRFRGREVAASAASIEPKRECSYNIFDF